jgi:hypothetical protein
MSWIIAILFSYAHAFECPRYECRQLKSNLCAELNSNVISVNSDGCQSGYGCHFYELGAWVYEKQPLSGEFECTEYYIYVDPYYNSTYPEPEGNYTTDPKIPDPRYNDTENPYIYPPSPDFLPPENYTESSEVYPSYISSHEEGNFNYSYIPWDPISNESYPYNPEELMIPCKYQELKNLAEGKHPKLCESDEDCQLQDGALAACKCGWDGNRYCVPDKYDDLWEPFWITCKREGQIYYWDEYRWINSIDTFVWRNSMTIEDELCANLVFDDFIASFVIMDNSTYRPDHESNSGESSGDEDGQQGDEDSEAGLRGILNEDATSIHFIALLLAIFMI